jgi:hypothetical protein
MARPTAPNTTPRYLSTATHNIDFTQSHRIMHTSSPGAVVLDPRYALTFFVWASIITCQSIPRTTTATLALSDGITPNSCVALVFVWLRNFSGIRCFADGVNVRYKDVAHVTNVLVQPVSHPDPCVTDISSVALIPTRNLSPSTVATFAELPVSSHAALSTANGNQDASKGFGRGSDY